MSVEERGVNEKSIRKMALTLDRMSRSVTSDEAEILETVLVKTKEKRPVSQAESDEITKMYDRYLALKEEKQEGRDPEEDGPDEYDFDGE